MDALCIPVINPSRAALGVIIIPWISPYGREREKGRERGREGERAPPSVSVNSGVV